MPIPFSCPQCGHYTEVDEIYVGRSGPCVSCGNNVTVPSAAPTSVPAQPKRRRRSLLLAAAILIAISLAGLVGFSIFQSLLLPAIESARQSTRYNACKRNLRRISTALRMYHEDYGCYPPAAVLSDSGTPIHSWRVLLLPYLGPEAELLYAQYDFDQSWNSPANSLLNGAVPSIYACPSDEGATIGETSYLAITGSDTAFGEQPTSLADITDDHGVTVLVMEASNSGVVWLEPKDISMKRLQAGLNLGGSASPGSQHVHGVNVLTADGEVKRLDDSTSPSELRAMSTISGAEPIDIDYAY